MGSNLAASLEKRGHSVAIIDIDQDAFRRLGANFRGSTVKGVGFDRSVLVEAGIENAVATPAITAALYARFVSRQDDSPTMKAVAAMRNQFGGHAVKTPPPPGGDVNPDQS